MAQPQSTPTSQQFLAQQAMLARHQATQAQQAQQAQQSQAGASQQAGQLNYQQIQNAQVQRQQAQQQQAIAGLLMQQQQQQAQAAQPNMQSSPNPAQGQGAPQQQNIQAAIFAAQAQRQQALTADSSPQAAARSSPNMNGAAAKTGNGMRIDSIMQNLPSFIQMMDKGQLSDLQVQQLRNILTTPSAQAHLKANATPYQQQIAAQQASLATNNTNNVRPPANLPNGMTAQQAQAQLSQFQASSQQVATQAQLQQRQAQAQVQAQAQSGVAASPRPPAQPPTAQQQNNIAQHQKALQQITSLEPARRAEIFAKNPQLRTLWEKHASVANPAVFQAHINDMNLRRQQQITQHGQGSSVSPAQNAMQLPPTAAAGVNQANGDLGRVGSPALPGLQIPAGRQRTLQQQGQMPQANQQTQLQMQAQAQVQQLQQQQAAQLQQNLQQQQQHLQQQQQRQMPKAGQAAAPTAQQQQLMVRAAAIAQAQAQAAIAAANAAASNGATANVATQASLQQARMQQMAQLQQVTQQQGPGGNQAQLNVAQRINQLQQQSAGSRPVTNSPRPGAVPQPRGPNQGPMPQNGFAPATSFTNTAYTPTEETDAALKEVLQAAYKWPNLRGPRPTLTLGLGSAPIVGMPALLKMPADVVALDEVLSDVGGARGPDGELLDVQEQEIVGRGMPGGKKRRIVEVAQEVDRSLKLNAGVEDFCLELADEFFEAVADVSCQLAKRRGGDRLEIKDIQLHLERNLGIVVPGFASDSIRLDQVHTPRKANANSKHLSRLRAVNEAKLARSKELAAERSRPE